MTDNWDKSPGAGNPDDFDPDAPPITEEEIHISDEDLDRLGGTIPDYPASAPGDPAATRPAGGWSPTSPTVGRYEKTAPRTDSAWQRLKTNNRIGWERVFDAILDWPTSANRFKLAAVYAAVGGILVAFAVGAWEAFAAILIGVWHMLLAVANGGRQFVANWKLTHLVTDPINHFFTTQAAGTGVDPHFLTKLWGVVLLIVLVLASLFGSRGARWGWIACGLATAGMVWAGAPATHRELSVVLTVAAWSLLSVLALGALSGPIVFNRYPVVERVKYAPPAPAPVYSNTEPAVPAGAAETNDGGAT